MNLGQSIQAVWAACALGGHTPVGANSRAVLEDACTFAGVATEPADELDVPIWRRGQEGAAFIVAAYANLDAGGE